MRDDCNHFICSGWALPLLWPWPLFALEWMNDPFTSWSSGYDTYYSKCTQFYDDHRNRKTSLGLTMATF